MSRRILGLIDGKPPKITVLERAFGWVSAETLAATCAAGLIVAGLAGIPLFYISMAHFTDRGATMPWLDLLWMLETVLIIGCIFGLFVAFYITVSADEDIPKDRVTPE